MESNYIKSLQIKLKQHPEWDRERKFSEIRKAYGKAGSECYLTANNTTIIIPNMNGKRPIKFVHEGGRMYEY